MISRTNKNEIRWRIHKRIRRKVRGTPERPRLAIFRSLSHIYAQLVDDTQGKTLVAAASSEKALHGAIAAAPAPVEAAPATAPDAAEPQTPPAKGGKGDKKGEKKSAKKAAPPVKISGGNVAGAKLIGKTIAERAKEKGIKQVVFDRGGYIYHGRVKALADAAREAGLEF
jgi:large subunit ribosomal protein L18